MARFNTLQEYLAASQPTAVGNIPPQTQRGAAAQGEFEQSLYGTESGGNFGASNTAKGAGGHVGHFGRGQFGQARLDDFSRAMGIGQITGDQFMADPNLQQNVEQWHWSDIEQFIGERGLDRYEGQQIGGVPITRSGMLAVAHLGGKGGLQKFLETGGQYNPSDENGTSLLDYAATHGGLDAQGAGAAQPQPPQRRERYAYTRKPNLPEQPIFKDVEESQSLFDYTPRAIGERAAELVGNLAGIEASVQDLAGPLGYDVLDMATDASEWLFGLDDMGDPRRAIQRELTSVDLGAEEPPAPEQVWDDFKAGNIGSVLRAGAMYGIASVPDMVAATNPATMPAYIASRTEEIATERARADGREGPPAPQDLAVAAPAAVAISIMERIAGRFTLPGFAGGRAATGTGLRGAATRTGQAAVIEGATEVPQEALEYAATNVGTEEGFDPRQAGLRSFTGLVGGATTGGGIRGGVEATAATGRALFGDADTDFALQEPTSVDEPATAIPAGPEYLGEEVPEAAAPRSWEDAVTERERMDDALFGPAVDSRPRERILPMDMEAALREQVYSEETAATRAATPEGETIPLFREQDTPEARDRTIPQMRLLRRMPAKQLRAWLREQNADDAGTRRDLLQTAQSVLEGTYQPDEVATASQPDTDTGQATIDSLLAAPVAQMEQDAFAPIRRAIRQAPNPELRERAEAALAVLEEEDAGAGGILEVLYPLTEGQRRRLGEAEKTRTYAERAIAAFLPHDKMRYFEPAEKDAAFDRARKEVFDEARRGLQRPVAQQPQWRRAMTDALGSALAALNVREEYWVEEARRRLSEFAREQADRHSAERTGGPASRAALDASEARVVRAIEEIAAPLIASESRGTDVAIQNLGRFNEALQRGATSEAARIWPNAYASLYAFDPLLADDVRRALGGELRAVRDAQLSAERLVNELNSETGVIRDDPLAPQRPPRSARKGSSPWTGLAETFADDRAPLEPTEEEIAYEATREEAGVEGVQRELLSQYRDAIVDEVATEARDKYGFQLKTAGTTRLGKIAVELADAGVDPGALIEADGRPEIIDHLRELLADDAAYEAVKHLLPAAGGFLDKPVAPSVLGALFRLQHNLGPEQLKSLVQRDTISKSVEDALERGADPMTPFLRKAVETVRLYNPAALAPEELKGADPATKNAREITALLSNRLVARGLQTPDIDMEAGAQRRHMERLNRWKNAHKKATERALDEALEGYAEGEAFYQAAQRTEAVLERSETPRKRQKVLDRIRVRKRKGQKELVRETQRETSDFGDRVTTFAEALREERAFRDAPEDSRTALLRLAKALDQDIEGKRVAGRTALPVPRETILAAAERQARAEAAEEPNWAALSPAQQDAAVKDFAEQVTTDMVDLVRRANAARRARATVERRGKVVRSYREWKKAAEEAAKKGEEPPMWSGAAGDVEWRSANWFWHDFGGFEYFDRPARGEPGKTVRLDRQKLAPKYGPGGAPAKIKVRTKAGKERLETDKEYRERIAALREGVTPKPQPDMQAARGAVVRSRSRPLRGERRPIVRRVYPRGTEPTVGEYRSFSRAVAMESVGRALDGLTVEQWGQTVATLGVRPSAEEIAAFGTRDISGEVAQLLGPPPSDAMTYGELQKAAKRINDLFDNIGDRFGTQRRIRRNQSREGLRKEAREAHAVAEGLLRLEAYYDAVVSGGDLDPAVVRGERLEGEERLSRMAAEAKRRLADNVVAPLLHATDPDRVRTAARRIKDLDLPAALDNAIIDAALLAAGAEPTRDKRTKARAWRLVDKLARRVGEIGISPADYASATGNYADMARQITGAKRKRKAAPDEGEIAPLEAETLETADVERERGGRRDTRGDPLEEPDEGSYYEMRGTTLPTHRGDRNLQRAFVANGDRPVPADAVLDLIANNTRGPLRQTAMRLRRLGLRTQVRRDFLPRDENGIQFGEYSSADDVATINFGVGIAGALHELMHAATAHNLRNNPVLRARVEALLERVRARNPEADEYGLTDADEFVAEGFSNLRFQRLLRNTALDDNRSGWQRFVDTIRSVLGLGVSRNVLDDLMSLDTDLMAPAGARLDVGTFNLIQKNGAPAMARAADWWHHWSSTRSDALRARYAEFAAQTLRQIARRYEERFRNTEGESLLRNYIDILARKWTKARQLQNASKDLIGRYEKYASDKPDMVKRLDEAMTYATLYGVDPTKLDAEQKKGFNKHALSQARDKLRRVDVDGVKLFKDVRDYFDREWDRTINAIVSNNVNARGVGVDPQDIRRAVERMKSEKDPAKRDKIRDDLIQKIKTESPEATAELAIVTIENVAEAIDARHYDGLYFPLRRFGEYVTQWRGRFDRQGLTTDELEQMLAAHPELIASKREKRNDRWDVEFSVRLVEFSETASAASRTREGGAAEWERLKKQFPELETSHDGVTTWLRQQQFSPGDSAGRLLTLIDSKLNSGELSKAEHMNMREAVISMMPGTSVNAARMRRQNVAMLRQDMLRTLAAHSQASSYWIAQMEEGRDAGRALQRLDDFIKERERAGEAESLVKEGRLVNFLRLRDERESTVTDIPTGVRALLNLGVANYLHSLSYSVVNATQPFIVGVPYLNSRFGGKRVAQEFGRAVNILTGGTVASALQHGLGFRLAGKSQYERSRVFDSIADRATSRIAAHFNANPKLKPHLKELLEIIQHAEDSGIIDMTHAMDTRRTAEGKSGKGVVEVVMDVGRLLPHAVEVQNRMTMLLSAYMLMKSDPRRKYTRQELERGIVDAIETTQIDYSVWNEPLLLSDKGPLGPAAPLLGMFMKYSQGIISLFADGISQLRTKGERKQGAKLLAGMLAAHTLAGGIAGGIFIQPLRLAVWMLGFMFYDDEDDPDQFVDDMDAYTMNFMAEALGPDAAEAAVFGLPRLAGVDVSSRISLGHLLGGFWHPGRTGVETTTNFMVAQMGPVFALGPQVARMAEAAEAGNTAKAIGYAPIPKVFRDIAQGVNLWNRGLETRAGGEIKSADFFSPSAVAWEVVGFTPAEVAATYERRNHVLGIKGRTEKRAAQLRNQFVRAATPRERAGALERIRHFNRENRYQITGDSLKSLAAKRAKQAAYARAGYTTTSTREAQLYESEVKY